MIAHPLICCMYALRAEDLLEYHRYVASSSSGRFIDSPESSTFYARPSNRMATSSSDDASRWSTDASSCGPANASFPEHEPTASLRKMLSRGKIDFASFLVP